jgi:hypothetical protein
MSRNSSLQPITKTKGHFTAVASISVSRKIGTNGSYYLVQAIPGWLLMVPRFRV